MEDQMKIDGILVDLEHLDSIIADFLVSSKIKQAFLTQQINIVDSRLIKAKQNTKNF